jgi:hypothetical protein
MCAAVFFRCGGSKGPGPQYLFFGCLRQIPIAGIRHFWYDLIDFRQTRPKDKEFETITASDNGQWACIYH